MKNLAIFSVLAAFACSPVIAEDNTNELTLAFNNGFTQKMVIPSSHRIEQQASEQELESLNKAMDKLNDKLNNELEIKISKSLDLEIN